MEKRKFQVDNYISSKKRKRFVSVILIFILATLFLLSLVVGQYGVSIPDTIKALFGIDTVDAYKAEMIIKVILNIRLPRTIAAILIGGALSLAGITYQCVFRNMLVSQDVLGVSTGACVGAAIAIVLDLSVYYIQLFSFLTGIISVILVLLLANAIKTDKTLSMILSGVLISGLMSSVLGFIKYTANPETHLQNIVYWIMGDISSINMIQIKQIVIPMVICSLLIFINKWRLNFFCYSDNEAKNLGININMYRLIFIGSATILVSLAVSVSGSIGWIGLVIPQLARTIIGTDNVDTVPLAFVMGSIFLLFIDIVNRLISAAELPVSILTGIVGTPIFVICLIGNLRKKHST